MAVSDAALTCAYGVVHEAQPVLQLNRDLEQRKIASREWLKNPSLFFLVPDAASRAFLCCRRGAGVQQEAFVDLIRGDAPAYQLAAAEPTAMAEAVVVPVPTLTAESQLINVMTVLICGERFGFAGLFDDPELAPMVQCVMPEAASLEQQVRLAASEFVKLIKLAYQRAPNLCVPAV